MTSLDRDSFFVGLVVEQIFDSCSATLGDLGETPRERGKGGSPLVVEILDLSTEVGGEGAGIKPVDGPNPALSLQQTADRAQVDSAAGDGDLMTHNEGCSG